MPAFKHSTVSDILINKCWVFTHLQKAGGSTVKGIVKDS